MNQYISQQEQRAQTTKRIFIWVGLVLVVAASVFGIYKLSQTDNGTVLGNNINIEDHKRGPDDAKVKLVEYSDFQCPACGAFKPVVEQLITEYGDRIQFVYRHFPLKSIHGQAEIAGEAAEAAGMQGKFWEMYNKIFDNQSTWAGNFGAEEMFINYAREIGLDEGKFRADLKSGAVRNKVDKDLADAESIGLNSTPSFFLNGNKIANPSSYDQFRELIEAELAK